MMDITLFENVRSLTALYKNIPQLQDVEIIKIIVVPGEDLELILTLDTSELPEKLPLKWLDRKVNTVQIEFDFIGVRIINFNIDNGSNYCFTIERLRGNEHIIILTNKANCDKIKFEARWAYIKNISGYTKE